MEAQLTTYVADTPKGGKATPKEARLTKPKLTQEDEFSILLTQINSCRDAGINLEWIKLKPEGVVALKLPSVQLCPNNHLHIGDKCNYCPAPVAIT